MKNSTGGSGGETNNMKNSIEGNGGETNNTSGNPLVDNLPFRIIYYLIVEGDETRMKHI